MLTSSEHNSVSLLKKHWIKLGIATVLVVLYGLLGFLWVPKLINDKASGYVNAELHRHLEFGSVEFNPFTLTVHVTKTKLSEANKTLIASIDDLLVNMEISSLWHRALVFKQVRIASPVINTLISKDGELNLAALQPPDQQPTTASTTPPRIYIERFELLQGQLRFADYSRPTPFETELKPITFTLQNFRTEPDYENAFHFAALSDDKESLDWRGDFTVQPLSANGKFKIAALKAETIQSYLQDTLPFLLLSGSIDLDGTYKLAISKSLNFSMEVPRISISNAGIAPKAGDKSADKPVAWVTLPQADITDAHISLQDHSVTIKQIEVKNADIQAALNAQHQLNLLQLLDSGQKKDGASTWHAKLDVINFDATTIHATDQSVQPAVQFTLSPAHIHLQNFSTAPATELAVDVQATIDGSAQLVSKGTVKLDTMETQLNIRLTDFALASLQNYATQSSALTIKDGKLATAGDLNYKGNATNNKPQIQYSGSVDITQLTTLDAADNSDFIKWRHLQLRNLRYSMAPDQLTIENIVMHEPFIRMAINTDATTNIQQVLRTAPVTTPVPAGAVEDHNVAVANAPTATPMKIKVGKVVVDNGNVAFSDASIAPAFAASIQHLNGDIVGLSSTKDTRATINLQGEVDTYSPVSINGEANFLAASTYSDLSIKFHNMELTTFNPYSGKFAGYNINKGKLTTDLHYIIVDRKLTAQHHIVIDQLEFGKATESKDAVSIPVKLAVALLKDRNGVIELDLPVGGSLDDPSFRVAPVIWQAFRNLLSKIVTSPFAALGSLFGGSGDELAYVDFAPGSAALSAAETDKLNKLSHALVERPQLKLNIPLNASADADSDALSQAVLDQALQKQLSNAATSTPQQRLDAMVRLYKEKTGNVPEFSLSANKSIDVVSLRATALQKQLLPLFQADKESRDALANQRADAVQSAVLTNTELSPERVFMVAVDSSVKPSKDTVRMELKLE